MVLSSEFTLLPENDLCFARRDGESTKKAPEGAFSTFKYVVAAQRNLLFVNIGAVA